MLYIKHKDGVWYLRNDDTVISFAINYSTIRSFYIYYQEHPEELATQIARVYAIY